DSRVAAAMSIVVPTTVDPQRLAPAVRTAALSASRRLRERDFRADPKPSFDDDPPGPREP
ncbi:MAG TPA: hypothetical protein VFR35_14910, partial [Actinoplanes sp.]|nr:hypothetical protein [Actinoplanes sp.]